MKSCWPAKTSRSQAGGETTCTAKPTTLEVPSEVFFHKVKRQAECSRLGFLSWGVIVIPTYHINDITLKVWEKCTFTCLLYAIAVHALRTGNIWTTYDKGSLLLGTCWFSHSILPSIELPAVNSMGLPCALIFSIGALVNIRVSITILVKEFGPPGLAPRYCYRECGTKGLARRVWY